MVIWSISMRYRAVIVSKLLRYINSILKETETEQKIINEVFHLN